MNPKCQNCGSENIKYVQAGTYGPKHPTKAGKPYNAFSQCLDCNAYQNKTQNAPKKTQTTLPQGGNEEVMNALRELYRITKVSADNIAEIRELLEMRRDNLDPSRIDFGS
jgi:hypothetical protein